MNGQVERIRLICRRRCRCRRSRLRFRSGDLKTAARAQPFLTTAVELRARGHLRALKRKRVELAIVKAHIALAFKQHLDPSEQVARESFHNTMRPHWDCQLDLCNSTETLQSAHYSFALHGLL